MKNRFKLLPFLWNSYFYSFRNRSTIRLYKKRETNERISINPISIKLGEMINSTVSYDFAGSYRPDETKYGIEMIQESYGIQKKTVYSVKYEGLKILKISAIFLTLVILIYNF